MIFAIIALVVIATVAIIFSIKRTKSAHSDEPTKNLQRCISTKCIQCNSDNTVVIQKIVQLPKDSGVLNVIISIFCLLIAAAIFFALLMTNVAKDETIDIFFGSMALSTLFFVLAGNFLATVIFATLYHFLRPFRIETQYYVLCKDCGHYHRIYIEDTEE